MKTLKSIGQVLAAIVYTCIFTGLLYLVLVFPLAWLLSLDTKVMILLLILLGGLLSSIIFGAQVLILLPYGWIVKNNVVALVISIGLMVFNLTRSDVMVWQSVLGHGTSAVVVAIIVTVFIVGSLFMSIAGVWSVYTESKD